MSPARPARAESSRRALTGRDRPYKRCSLSRPPRSRARAEDGDKDGVPVLPQRPTVVNARPLSPPRSRSWAAGLLCVRPPSRLQRDAPESERTCGEFPGGGTPFEAAGFSGAMLDHSSERDRISGQGRVRSLMTSKKRSPAPFAACFVIGALGLTRFGHGVPAVDIWGLFVSGIACGVAIKGFIEYLRRKREAAGVENEVPEVGAK